MWAAGSWGAVLVSILERFRQGLEAGQDWDGGTNFGNSPHYGTPYPFRPVVDFGPGAHVTLGNRKA